MKSFGCARCFGTDAGTAWTAMRATREATVVQESHFSVHVAKCDDCGQRFIEVFMERIDWRDGDDDQTWCLFPVQPDEVATLRASAEADIEPVVNTLARGRRFLVRARGSAGAMQSWWREDGFTVGPHD